MDCSNMNQRRCGCNSGCGSCRPQMMIQPDFDCSCGEPPTMIPDRPMPRPCCNATMPAQTRCDCPNTGVGGMEMYPIAMGHIPWQQWQQTYALDRGLVRGTIFPELDLPFVMGRCR